MDLVGPFKKAKGGFTHIFVAVDKFTKCIKEIMYKFGVPNNIIIDNGTQFTMREFKDFCAHSGIKINYASVSHPRSNG
jgi:transposase InsO family protein